MASLLLAANATGFQPKRLRLRGVLSEAGSYFENYRLPEVYAGITQQKGAFPIQYAQANVPQAWAAGSVFHLLQAILGLQADAPNHRLYVDPELPGWLPEITLRQLTIGNATVDLKFWREDEHTRWAAEVKTGDIEIQEKSWQPWH